MKDIKPLLLILLSIGLVGTWVFHLYDKAQYSTQIASASTVDSAAVERNIRDSLQQAYAQAISNLDFKLDSSQITADSLQLQLTLRVNEINKLRREIGGILKNRNATKEELNLAREKMGELETRVEELRVQNTSMEEEKEMLNTTLQKLTDEVKFLEQNIRTLDEENKSLSEKIRLASVFVATDINYAAIDAREVKEVETNQAKKADKFVASFTLQNNVQEFRNVEVYIVITGPDGKVLQSSTWDSGTFSARNGSKVEYTRQIKFDYERGEQKRLIFSLDVNNLSKGIYNLQIYHGGLFIGKAAQALR